MSLFNIVKQVESHNRFRKREAKEFRRNAFEKADALEQEEEKRRRSRHKKHKKDKKSKRDYEKKKHKDDKYK